MTAPARVPVELAAATLHPLEPTDWPVELLELLEDGDDVAFLGAVLPPAEAASIAEDDLDAVELHDLVEALLAELTTAH